MNCRAGKKSSDRQWTSVSWLVVVAIFWVLPVAYAQDRFTAAGIVGVVPTILIVAQSLYFGAAAGLRKNQKKWRHHSQEKRIWVLFMLIVLISAGQIVMLLVRDKTDKWSNALMTSGPLPILPPTVALMMYPLLTNRIRHKYRRRVAQWDTLAGNVIPLRTLCNTWWKWLIYVTTSVITFGVAGFAYHKTRNLYPLLSSIALPLLTSFLGAGLPLLKKLEDSQSDTRGNCRKDVIIAPIIGYSTSTSLIVLAYDQKKDTLQIERLQSILAHTNFAKDNYEAIRNAFGKKFSKGDDQEVTEFISDAKKLIHVVTTIGGWFKLSQQFVEQRDWIRQCLGSREVYNGYNTMMFCWNRAILESAIRVGCSRYKIPYDPGLENINIRTVGELFSLAAGAPLGAIQIMDAQGTVLDPDRVAKMMAIVTDARALFTVSAMMLDRMALSRDARSCQLITLAQGFDITFRANGRTGAVDVETHSTDISLDDDRLHGPQTNTSALERLRQISEEPLAIGLATTYERISAEFVPMNWTSYCMQRQHMFMYLLIYMAIAVVFVIFGQTQALA